MPQRGEIYQNQKISSETETKMDGRGRPTIADNFLVGARNEWVSLLEECWPDVGWGLLSIRRRPRSTVQDIQSVLAPLRKKPKGGLACAFLRQAAPGEANSELIRRSRQSLSDMYERLRRTSSEANDQIYKCNATAAALQQQLADQTERETIENECIQRYAHFVRLHKTVQALEQEKAAAEKKLADDEANFCQTQLLNYLTSRGRYAIEPLSLGNALAGLPIMAWRQSYERCSEMPYELLAHFSYRLLRVIIEIWRKRPEGALESLADFFKNAALSLGGDDVSVRDYLRTNWHDFKIAIEESLKAGYSGDAFAFAVTRMCISIVSAPKTPTQQILAEKEELKG
jgi:hypothetical protein